MNPLQSEKQNEKIFFFKQSFMKTKYVITTLKMNSVIDNYKSIASLH